MNWGKWKSMISATKVNFIKLKQYIFLLMFLFVIGSTKCNASAVTIRALSVNGVDADDESTLLYSTTPLYDCIDDFDINGIKVKKSNCQYGKAPSYNTLDRKIDYVFSETVTSLAAKKSSIKLNKSKATIYTSGGKTLQLKATVKGPSKKVTWKSSNEKIAVVNSKGKVTAKKPGTITITARANGKTAKCKITVKRKKTGTDKRTALAAYNNFLSQKTLRWTKLNSIWGYGDGDYSGSVSSNRCKFAIAYINNDSIPDLLVNTYDRGHADGYGMLYTYQKGKVKIVTRMVLNNLDDYRQSFYYEKKGLFTDTVTYFGHTTEDYLFLNNSCVIKKLSFSRNFSDNTDEYYSISNKQVTKLKFNQEIMKIVGKTKRRPFVFYDNTKANRNRYLN